MLTQLSTVKTRLALTVTDDGILTRAIKAVSTRFDKETNHPLPHRRSHERIRLLSD